MKWIVLTAILFFTGDTLKRDSLLVKHTEIMQQQKDLNNALDSISFDLKFLINKLDSLKKQ